MAEARAEWRRMQPDLQGRLIFLDETGARTDMTRRHAWSDVGTRALGRAPGGHWKTTTFLAGLTAEWADRALRARRSDGSRRFH